MSFGPLGLLFIEQLPAGGGPQGGVRHGTIEIVGYMLHESDYALIIHYLDGFTSYLCVIAHTDPTNNGFMVIYRYSSNMGRTVNIQ